jgi:hypothetical protein
MTNFAAMELGISVNPESSAGNEVQVVAQFLGNHDPSGLVDLHSGIHKYHFTI